MSEKIVNFTDSALFAKAAAVLTYPTCTLYIDKMSLEVNLSASDRHVFLVKCCIKQKM